MEKKNLYVCELSVRVNVEIISGNNGRWNWYE